MIILLENPKLFFSPNTTKIIGANKVSRVILDQLLINKKNHYIIVSDVSDTEARALTISLSKTYDHDIYVTNYNLLKGFLQEKKCVPSLAFVSDLKMSRMLYFRNINEYEFPVVSLIHSLGTRTAFHDFFINLPLIKEQDSYICPSYDTQKTVMKLGVKKSQTDVVHYGLETNLYKPIKNKSLLRKAYNIPLKKDVMLCLSRITPALKMDLVPIIRMMPELLKKNPNLHFLVVGEVHDQHYMKELKSFVTHLKLRDSVQFITKPNQSHIEHYYQCADLFFSLSDAAGESYGLTVMEAMSCGLPVIVSHIAGYKMHITDKKEGFYIPSFSSKVNFDDAFYYYDISQYGDLYAQSIAVDNRELKKAILRLSMGKGKREKMGQAGRKTIESRNTTEHMIQSYLNVFEKATKKKKTKNPDYQVRHVSDISDVLSHFPTRLLKKSDQFELTNSTKTLIKNEGELRMFSKHKQRYTKVFDIIYFLGKKSYSFKQLLAHCEGSSEEITLSLLYLLKHDFISLV